MVRMWQRTSLGVGGAALLALLAACNDPADPGPSVAETVWREVAASFGTTCAVDAAGTVHCVVGHRAGNVGAADAGAHRGAIL
jgi:hypothetical protein